MNAFLRKWSTICLFNLLLVALIGAIMRYKIIFPLRSFDQKNLLHAHSHFAFAGWITQALFCFLVNYLYEKGNTKSYKRYEPVMRCNLFTAHGMLLSFPFTGYSLLSILFSTLSIFVSYWFSFQYWNDLNRLPQKKLVVARWFKAAMLFLILSSIGAFSLAYINAFHLTSTRFYLSSIYFFLHFQYNGWFLFACMGLFMSILIKSKAEESVQKRIFYFFLAACLPAYFLSVLWLHIGLFLYIMIAIAVILQLAGWVLTLKIGRTVFINTDKNQSLRILLILIAIAMSFKLLLQAGSVVPSLSKLAFGLRPIVIGYLHLVLLGITTLFLLFYMRYKNAIKTTKILNIGLVAFITGIILNEILLMTQGLADINRTPIPLINLLLLFAAVVMGTGILMINLNQWLGKND